MCFLFCGGIFRLVKSALLFYSLIFAQVTSGLLVLWFDCCARQKRVPGFIVRLMRMSQAFSCFYVLIVTQLTIAFLVVFDCRAGDKHIFGIMVSLLLKL